MSRPPAGPGQGNIVEASNWANRSSRDAQSEASIFMFFAKRRFCSLGEMKNLCHIAAVFEAVSV